jgi:photosystem II stability/assembly factor-like uncharacterized protein
VITITDVGPNLTSFPRRPANDNHSSTGRITTLVLGADGSRMYAGSFAGVWRSDDAGATWSPLTWPQEPFTVQGEIEGALYAPHIFDLAASPVDPDVVLVCALDSQYADGRDGIYRTADGGATWALVFKSLETCNIVFAPDDPQLIYAVTTRHTTAKPPRNFGVVAISSNAGANWSVKTLPLDTSLWHVAVGPLEADGKRRVYGVGDGVVWYSTDGGQSWRKDRGVVSQIANVRSVLSEFQVSCGGNDIGGFGGEIQYAAGDAAQVLAIDPGNPARVFMATTGGALGPTYYSSKVQDGTLVNTRCERLAGEASLWLGDFTRFELNNGSASWELLPGPAVYTGETSPSGNCYVVAKPTSRGFLLFLSDNSHVHVSAGTPSDNSSWHRLDGMDASVAHRSDTHRNIVFMHPDPHAIAFTPDFEITLKPSTEKDPYNKNSELDEHIAGRLWMANDGGVYFCDDGGRNESSWQMPTGFETLDPVNIAGMTGHGSQPALYFGCGDNNDFFTRDGGQHWGDPRSRCGDCVAWFAVPAQGDRIVQFLPRRQPSDSSPKGFIGIVHSDGSTYPDAGDDGAKSFAVSTKRIGPDPRFLVPYASSAMYLIGYRPLVLTLATEAPLSGGDVIVVDQALDKTAFLFRTTAIDSIGKLEDWRDTSKAQQIGPQLPVDALAPQASGGHGSAVYYVGTAFMVQGVVRGEVYKLNQAQTSWDMIVPNNTLRTSVKPAQSWFVDPYEPNTLYVLDADGVKVSADGGRSWFFDDRFTRAITADHKLSVSASLLQDMLFLRGERQTRFAFGTAGVFWTETSGVEWLPLLNSIARPGRPESGFFDPLSDPADRALYVECEGRSIVRIGGIPAPPPFQASSFDLFEFAALEY